MPSHVASILAVALPAFWAGTVTAEPEPPTPNPEPQTGAESGKPSPPLPRCRCRCRQRGVLLPEPGAEREPFVPSAEPRPHRGLYLSPSLGMGELHLDFADRTVMGRTFSVGAELGIAVASNLIVYGELYEAHLFSPISNDEQLASANLLGFGPGLKYYVETTNLFLSGSLLFSQFRRNGTDSNYAATEKSYWGAGGRFSVGREWSVSRGWSLGLAGEVLLARMRRNPESSFADKSESTAKGFSLLLSCGYSYPPTDAGEPSPSGDRGPPPRPSFPPVGYHMHDGFYASARLGLGWLWVNTGSSALMSGRGFPFGLSVGFAPRQNLIVFGEFYEVPIFNPTSPVSGRFADLDLQGLGPGIKYYVMSKNMFLSGSLLISQLSFHNGIPSDPEYGISKTSDWGVTGRASVGREWWVSADWGLGLAGELVLGRMEGYTVKGGGILLSASFN
jgi:hypothetical protein